jgi:NAD(P)-dependent dehydrogenase (short-subunit alcohol dehydrogenase family)
LRIFSITSPCGGSMKAITFITPPHSGQAKGSISYTRFMSMAQVWLARLRAGAGAAGSPEAAASACFRRMPRALFEYIEAGVPPQPFGDGQHDLPVRDGSTHVFGHVDRGQQGAFLVAGRAGAALLAGEGHEHLVILASVAPEHCGASTVQRNHYPSCRASLRTLAISW